MVNVAKRAFDLLMALAGLVLLSPVLVLIVLVIGIDSKGSILFRSCRVGKGGKLFTMLKFRTMVDLPPFRASLVTPDDDPRITRVGKWLRRHKLDELPQLWNVVRGEMTLVGPRPQISRLVSHYSENERRTLLVSPGITDPASLRFWNEGALLRGSPDPDGDYLARIHPEKIGLSLSYLERRSFLSDIKVLVSTLLAWVGIEFPLASQAPQAR